ncbi:MAG: mechanosensitive ion channel family protein, partial [Acidimicrobiales bacterium]
MPLLAVSFQDRVTAFLDDLTDFVPKLLGAVAILIIGWIIARIIRRVVI